MPVSIYNQIPDKQVVKWLTENVGEYIGVSWNFIEGRGWRFDSVISISDKTGQLWTLTFEDEKMLTYYLLMSF